MKDQEVTPAKFPKMLNNKAGKKGLLILRAVQLVVK